MALVAVGIPAVLKALREIEGKLAYKGRKYIPFPEDKGKPDWVLTTDGNDNPYWAPVDGGSSGGGGGGGGGATGAKKSRTLCIEYISKRIVDNIDYGTTETSLDDIEQALSDKLPIMFSSDYGMFTVYKMETEGSADGLEFYATTYDTDFSFTEVSVDLLNFIPNMYYVLNESSQEYEYATVYNAESTYYLKSTESLNAKNYLVHFDIADSDKINIMIVETTNGG